MTSGHRPMTSQSTVCYVRRRLVEIIRGDNPLELGIVRQAPAAAASRDYPPARDDVRAENTTYSKCRLASLASQQRSLSAHR